MIDVCQRCGECCRTLTVELGDELHREPPCPFLSGGGECTIYAERPDACRHFVAGTFACTELRRRRGLPPVWECMAFLGALLGG